MTPAEWLAAILLGSLVIGVVRDAIDPDVVKLKINSGFWLLYFVLLIIVEVVLAIVVLL